MFYEVLPYIHSYFTWIKWFDYKIYIQDKQRQRRRKTRQRQKDVYKRDLCTYVFKYIYTYETYFHTPKRSSIEIECYRLRVISPWYRVFTDTGVIVTLDTLCHVKTTKTRRLRKRRGYGTDNVTGYKVPGVGG